MNCPPRLVARNASFAVVSWIHKSEFIRRHTAQKQVARLIVPQICGCCRKEGATDLQTSICMTANIISLLAHAPNRAIRQDYFLHRLSLRWFHSSNLQRTLCDSLGHSYFRVVTNSEVSRGVMSHMRPISSSPRLTFTVKICQLPGDWGIWLRTDRLSSVLCCI